MPDQTRHTPAPWIVDKHFVEQLGGRKYVPVIRPGNDPVPIAVIHLEVDGFGRGEGNANARLIGAAPELLAACKAGLAALDGGHLPGNTQTGDAARHALQTAIAKAEQS